MKVIVCPKCRISPDITATEIKCPKCGRTSAGVDLTDTVTKWDNEQYVDPGKKTQVVVKDIDEIKEEVKAEIGAEAPTEDPAEEKPVKKAAKTEKKPAKKKGAK